MPGFFQEAACTPALLQFSLLITIYQKLGFVNPEKKKFSKKPQFSYPICLLGQNGAYFRENFHFFGPLLNESGCRAAKNVVYYRYDRAWRFASAPGVPAFKRDGKARKKMILITGDTHGDFSRFQQPAVKKLKKEDALIICGDFGFVWDGSKKEQQMLKKIGKRRHDTLFVEGCRDNYDLLKGYPIVEYCGGKARQISGRLYQLLRGEIYELGGKKVFAFGGGYSDEEWLDIGHSSGMWWGEEQPSEEEMARGLERLREAGGHVDLIVSHDAPASIRRFIRIDDNEVSTLHAYLDEVAKACSFNRWFFGHYHLDKVVPPRFIAVFQSTQRVE